MKYASPGYHGYVMDDETERRIRRTPNDDKADKRREYERNVLKRGMRLVYAYIVLSLGYLVLSIGSLIFTPDRFIMIAGNFFFFIVWSAMAYYYYSSYRKIKAKAQANKSAAP